MSDRPGITRYSDRIKGAPGNYNWIARFDMTDGFLGITQIEEGAVKDRVLLSPAQVREMLDFIGKKKSARA
jgi:hypothetical protein